MGCVAEIKGAIALAGLPAELPDVLLKVKLLAVAQIGWNEGCFLEARRV